MGAAGPRGCDKSPVRASCLLAPVCHHLLCPTAPIPTTALTRARCLGAVLSMQGLLWPPGKSSHPIPDSRALILGPLPPKGSKVPRPQISASQGSWLASPTLIGVLGAIYMRLVGCLSACHSLWSFWSFHCNGRWVFIYIGIDCIIYYPSYISL